MKISFHCRSSFCSYSGTQYLQENSTSSCITIKYIIHFISRLVLAFWVLILSLSKNQMKKKLICPLGNCCRNCTLHYSHLADTSIQSVSYPAHLWCSSKPLWGLLKCFSIAIRKKNAMFYSPLSVYASKHQTSSWEEEESSHQC